jgi:hypothetical protein
VEITDAMMKPIAVAIYVAMALPLLPLALGWRSALRSTVNAKSWADCLGLSLVTLSYCCFWAVLGWGSVIARDYGYLPLATVWINMVVALAGMILAIVRGKNVAAPIVITTVMLLCLWYGVWIVSSIVIV